MTAEQLTRWYAEQLGWTDAQLVERLLRFIEHNDQTDALRAFLQAETGLDVETAEAARHYRGQPFAVFAYGPDYGLVPDAAFERIDVDTEILAMAAFSRLLDRPDLERFVVVQFNPEEASHRELMAYDRQTSSQSW